MNLGSRRSLEEGKGPTSVLSLGESHGQKGLAGYSLKESEMTEATLHAHVHDTYLLNEPTVCSEINTTEFL